jgi:hypothetical protein
MNNISEDILMAIGGGSMSMNISSKTTLQSWHSGLAVFMDGWKRGILSKKLRSREHAIFLHNVKKEQKVP